MTRAATWMVPFLAFALGTSVNAQQQRDEGAEGAEAQPAAGAEGAADEGAAAEGAAAEGAAAEEGAGDDELDAKPPAPVVAPSKPPTPALKDASKPGANIQTAPGADDGLPPWGPVAGTPVEPTGGAAAGPGMAANWDAGSSPQMRVSFPWIESHGYFRTRLELFHNLDLDTYDNERGEGSSPVLPPLTETRRGDPSNSGSEHPEDKSHQYKRGADTLAGANMRFRYQPTVHIAETLRVKSTIDVLDNIVLGSTPDGGLRGSMQRPDVPIVTFSGGQRPPESGVNAYQDAVRVKQLWGEWKTPLGLLMFGRVPSHWGLGILANNGNCLDCDFGDSVDRIMGVTKLFGTYLALAWDFPSEGVVGQSGLHTMRNQPAGQPHDLDQRDDVNEYVIALFRRPLTKEEKDIRTRELNEIRKPVFDWGVYNVIRTQEFLTMTNVYPAESGSQENMRDVKAFAYIPDLWLNFEYRPKRGHEFHVQFEATAVLGVIEELPQRATDPIEACQDRTAPTLDDCPAGQLYKPRRRDLAQWGYALEFDHRVEKLKWGLRHGAASGDKTPGFGVLDKLPLDSTDPSDDAVTNFKFDRDYVIDLILFREIIGTVTNAVYFKPYLSYDIIGDEREAWGFQIATLYAFALEKTATPGRESSLGLEFDLELYVHEYDRFRWSLQYGLLFPFGAFDYLVPNPDDPDAFVLQSEPGVAQTLQMSVGMMF